MIVVQLDRRLSICEQAHADSLLVRNRDRAIVAKTHRKQIKIAIRKGLVWGVLAGITTAFLIQSRY